MAADREQLAEEGHSRLEDLAAADAERCGAFLQLGEHRSRLFDLETARAIRGANRPVHLDDLAAPRSAMQHVDVLSQDRPDETAPLELGEREMAGVRLGGQERVDPSAVEPPDTLGIALERSDRRYFEGIDLDPDSRRRAEVGDTALGRDAGPGQHDAWLPLDDEGS